MNCNHKYTLVIADDWEGLYRDGELLTQGHSLSMFDVFGALGLDLGKVRPDNTWLEAEGLLPTYLEDVKRAEYQ